MLDLRGIKKTLEKLEKVKQEDPGEIKCVEKGRAEVRYSYYYEGTMVFTFGITRGSQAKSKQFGYVPRQMLLEKKQYKLLHDCPWTKGDYNKEIIRKKKV